MDSNGGTISLSGGQQLYYDGTLRGVAGGAGGVALAYRYAYLGGAASKGTDRP
mgnify:CR=1 FL=1